MSVNKRLFYLPSYSLIGGNYQVVLQVSSGNTSTKISSSCEVIVEPGQINVIVKGGNTRQVAVTSKSDT